MANITRHRFASGKTDGPDATQVQPSNWNDGHVFVGGAAGDVLTRDPSDAVYGAKWATPPTSGAWIDVPYSAANFGAGGAMTWSVPAPSVFTYAYATVNKILSVFFYIAPTTIGGSPDIDLRLVIPGGYLPARYVEALSWTIDTSKNTAAQLMRIRASPGQSYLQLFLADMTNYQIPWPNGSGRYAIGQITLPIL